MDDSIQMVLAETKELMEDSIGYLRNQLLKIRTGKASTDILADVKVNYYGTDTPISQVGNVSVADARMLTVAPWEKSLIPAIEKSIRESGLGLNPVSDGDLVRVPIPALNEERRVQLVKQAKGEGEQARVSIRTVRKDANEQLKKLQKDGGVSEDEVKVAEKKVQDLTDQFTKQVDDLLKDKEGQIMTV